MNGGAENLCHSMSNNWPLVSICIPAYDKPDLILQCVKSALAQTYQNKEVIVSDDSDNEQVYSVLKEYVSQNQIKYCQNKSRQGRLANYRRLLHELASGDWVMMLDGDDYFTDNSYIEKCIKDSISRNDSILYYFARHSVDESKQASMETNFIIKNGFEYIKNPVEFCSKFSHLTSLYKRRPAIESDFYQFNDLHGFLKLASIGFIAYYPHFAGVWRNVPMSQSKSLSEQDLDNIFRCFQKPGELGLFVNIQISNRYILYYFINYLFLINRLPENEKNHYRNVLIQSSRFSDYFSKSLEFFLIHANNFILKFYLKLLNILY